MDFTLDNMHFTLDNMDFTLDYTEIHASDWSEAQSREIALWILISFELGEFRLGDVSAVNQGTLSDY